MLRSTWCSYSLEFFKAWCLGRTVGVVYEICGIQGHIAIDCQTNFQGLEHANAFKISTHGDKTTLTQTLTTQDEKIIQISPTETPTPCRPMPLNPLASRIDHLITHLYPLYNNVTCKFLWSTSTQTKAKDMLLEKFDYGALILGPKFLHMQCSAYILNLIVKDGFDIIGKEIERIRDCIAL